MSFLRRLATSAVIRCRGLMLRKTANPEVVPEAETKLSTVPATVEIDAKISLTGGAPAPKEGKSKTRVRKYAGSTASQRKTMESRRTPA